MRIGSGLCSNTSPLAAGVVYCDGRPPTAPELGVRLRAGVFDPDSGAAGFFERTAFIRAGNGPVHSSRAIRRARLPASPGGRQAAENPGTGN